MKTVKTQSPKQKLAAMLRRKEYAGCRGQVSYHGMGRVSVQIFAPTDGSTALLVADVNL